jgi:hypothetical protein
MGASVIDDGDGGDDDDELLKRGLKRDRRCTFCMVFVAPGLLQLARVDGVSPVQLSCGAVDDNEARGD